MPLTTILVTGGAGYVGSFAVRRLLREGFRVVVVDDLRNGYRAAIGSAELQEIDLCDKEALTRCFAEVRPDAVMHFAALASVPESVRNPRPYFWNNLCCGLSLLEAMLRVGCTKLIFSSSAAVYGVPEQIPIPEEAPKNPTNPYGLTKLQFEQILRWYDRAYGLRSVALRYFCAAGAASDGSLGEAHDPETHLIPNVLEAALGHKPKVAIYGDDYDTPDGTCIRDFIHVEDLAAAHVLALRWLDEGGATAAFNCGLGRGWSVREVIAAAERVTGVRIPQAVEQRRPGDPPVLVADASRIAQEMGFSAEYTDLEEIIRTAWQWHRAGGPRRLQMASQRKKQ